MALDALQRITEGAYANLVLPSLLERSELSERDRGFATELVYGATRMRRSLDWLIDPHLRRGIEPVVRDVLRLGAYQLRYLRTPAHAAVSETVAVAPPRSRSFVNAVLRSMTRSPDAAWPDLATELSYPDWVVERLSDDLGAEVAEAALRAMNASPEVTRRADGYVQDLASQWVGAAVDVRAGATVADLCAAPGGKATAIAGAGAAVVAASDVLPARASLVAGNAEALGRSNVAVVVADGRRPPYRPGSFDRVLVDAPCSGLGVLRRRPDARWRIQGSDVDDLVALQRALLAAAIDLVRPGGELVYSVCTLTSAETLAVDEWLATAWPSGEALPRPGDPWEPSGRGARLLPQSAGTDGMYLLRLRST